MLWNKSIASNSKPFAAALLLWTTMAFGARTPVDNHYFISNLGVFSINVREGLYDFGNNRVERVERKALPAFGLTCGKNFRLPFGIRLNMPLSVEYGQAREDTTDEVQLDNGTKPELIINSCMFHAGILPNLQFPVRLWSKTWMFGILGGGINYVNFYEEERIAADLKKRVLDPYLIESSRVSLSLAAGAGIEFDIIPQLSLFVQYMFGFWEPVKKKVYRDLFPIENKLYSERFYSHSFTWGILFARQH